MMSDFLTNLLTNFIESKGYQLKCWSMRGLYGNTIHFIRVIERVAVTEDGKNVYSIAASSSDRNKLIAMLSVVWQILTKKNEQ